MRKGSDTIDVWVDYRLLPGAVLEAWTCQGRQANNVPAWRPRAAKALTRAPSITLRSLSGGFRPHRGWFPEQPAPRPVAVNGPVRP